MLVNIKSDVLKEIYVFVGKEFEKARDVDRQRAFKHIQKMMRSHLHQCMNMNQPVTEANVADLLHDFRRQIKQISKVHNPNIASWNVYEAYRSAFHAFFNNPEITKTIEGFRATLFEYIV